MPGVMAWAKGPILQSRKTQATGVRECRRAGYKPDVLGKPGPQRAGGCPELR
jgi:hypothetical protein